MLGLVRLSCSLACRLFFERDPDLRDRVVGSVAAGRSCRATAALFGVSVARVVKWCQRWRATGSQAWGRRRDRDLTEASRFPASWVSDSRCWLGLGASIDGETLFEGSSGPGCRFGCGGSLVPGDGGAVWGERGQRGEVVPALAGDREYGGVSDGRLAAALAEERAAVASGADCGEAGPDVASGGERAGRTRHPGELRRGVAVLRSRRDHVQKKACTPASKTGPTSPGGAPDGNGIRAGLTRGAWYSSTRLGPRPT